MTRGVASEARNTQASVMSSGRGAGLAASPVTSAPEGREALDAAPLWADPRAHRETRVAPDMIERTVRGRSKDEEPVDPGEVFLRSVLMPRSTRMLPGVESKAVPC